MCSITPEADKSHRKMSEHRMQLEEHLDLSLRYGRRRTSVAPAADLPARSLASPEHLRRLALAINTDAMATSIPLFIP